MTQTSVISKSKTQKHTKQKVRTCALRNCTCNAQWRAWGARAQTNKQTNKQTHKHTNRQASKQTNHKKHKRWQIVAQRHWIKWMTLQIESWTVYKHPLETYQKECSWNMVGTSTYVLQPGTFLVRAFSFCKKFPGTRNKVFSMFWTLCKDNSGRE